jgi:hypothetical protein
MAALAAFACGKRGNPLPPLRPVPTRILDASAVRAGDRVTITFTVPAANVDGTTPAAVTRIDVFAWRGAQGATPPAASVIASERSNLVSSLTVVPPPAEGAPVATTPSQAVVVGSSAQVSDDIESVDTKDAVLAYVLVPVAGTGRGRPGPPSAPLVVPVAALPPEPTGVILTHDETDVRVSWDAPADVTGRTFAVVRTNAAGDPIDAPAIPVASSAREATFPVEFGRPVCVAVRASVAAGRVTTVGALSRPACLTPVDRYAPPAPTGFQAVQEGTAVVLSWTALTVSDLAGYVVLRGQDTADTLQPLMRAPIKETTYRDTTVRPGVTYFYAVYAEDTASPANVSQLSARQSVTVR